METELKAGRKLDALIAELIFDEPEPTYPDPEPMHSSRIGQSEKGQWYAHRGDKKWYPRPCSTDIRAAMQIPEKLGMGMSLDYHPENDESERWYCNFFNGEVDGEALASTVSEAICLAALACPKV
jgi:hypothetical protein